MRVIFMGTPDFSVATFETLITAGHEVALTVTQPDRPRGRGKSMQYPPVKEAALAHGIEVFQPQRIRESGCIAYLRNFKPDVIVVVAFGQILPKEILEIPPYGCVNIHASLLPKYRGASPIQWAVINGEQTTGVTAMRMDERMDTGDIIMQREVALDEKETGGSLFEKLSEEGAGLCVEVLSAIEDGTAVYTPQDHSLATKVGLIDKKFGHIDWDWPADRIERLIRGLSPWPSAYTFLNGRTFKIWSADVLTQNTELPPGSVAEVTHDAIHVQTGNGILALKEVQLEGKKRMPCSSFLRGFSMDKIDRFDS